MVVFLGARIVTGQEDTNPILGDELVAAVNLPQNDVKGEATLFLPRKVDHVRAVIVIIRYGLGGSAIYYDQEWRRLSETLQIALVRFRTSSISSESTVRFYNDARLGGADSLVSILRRLAIESRHPELADVPLLFWGHSSAGPFGATFAAQHPERTIAFVRYHSGNVSADLKIVSKIPALFLVGANDTNFPQAAIDAENLWKSGRSQGAPWTWAIEPEATHGDLRDVEKANILVIPWVRAVLNQRLMENGTELRDLTDKTGWTGDPRTGEIVPHVTIQGSKETGNWLPDQSSAIGWKAVSFPSKK